MRTAATRLTVMVLGCFAACRSQSVPKTDQPAKAVTEVVAPVDVNGCDPDTAFAHPDPRQLVDEYLQRDGSGAFLRSDSWYASALECPGHSPGWDAATLVTSFSEAPSPATTADTAVFVVTYLRHSYLEQDSIGFFLNPAPGTESDTFIVVRSPHGWRIRAPIQEPHVLPAAAVRLHLRPKDSLGVAKLARLRAPGV